MTAHQIFREPEAQDFQHAAYLIIGVTYATPASVLRYTKM